MSHTFHRLAKSHVISVFQWPSKKKKKKSLCSNGFPAACRAGHAQRRGQRYFGEAHTGQSCGEQPWSKHMELRLFFDTDKVLFHEEKSSSKSSTCDDILMLQVPKSEGINGGMDSIRHHKFPYSHQDASTSGGMNHGLDGIMGLRFAGATGGRSRRLAACA
jgi:hypothetical protein